MPENDKFTNKSVIFYNSDEVQMHYSLLSFCIVNEMVATINTIISVDF